MYNLLNPFSIAGMYMCPGLTTWSVYEGAQPWKKLILHLSSVIDDR